MRSNSADKTAATKKRGTYRRVKNKTPKRPNIIFIMIDDLGYGDLGCYGSNVNSTPNIDALARGGILFHDYHANGPVCSPTRASFMTGMYQHRFGKKFEIALSGVRDYDDGLPLKAFTIAEALKEEGYKPECSGNGI